MTDENDFDLDDPQLPQEAFHMELDLYDNGEHYDVLFIPCNDVVIVVAGNEHFTTMRQSGVGADGWEQQDGQLEDEVFDKLSAALGNYMVNQ